MISVAFWVAVFGVLYTTIPRSNCAVSKAEKIAELVGELHDGDIAMPDFVNTFEIANLVEMKYRLTNNSGKDLSLGSWTFEIPGAFAELQSKNTSVSISGIFDADIKIFGKYKNGSSYTITITVTGIYSLNLTEVHMNHTMERPRPGLALMKPHECIITSSKSKVWISKTIQNLPRSFLDELSDWMSRALNEDLQRLLCESIDFQMKRGLANPIVRDMLRNINCAEKQRRTLKLGRHETMEGC